MRTLTICCVDPLGCGLAEILAPLGVVYTSEPGELPQGHVLVRVLDGTVTCTRLVSTYGDIRSLTASFDLRWALRNPAGFRCSVREEMTP